MESFIGEFKSFIQTKVWSGGSGTGDEIEIIGPSLGKSTREHSLQRAASNLGKNIGKATVTGITEAETSPKRLTGTVLKFIDPKGYGFVEADDTNEKLFFHIKETAEPGLVWLSRDERISFIIGEDSKGRKQAEKLVLIEGRKR
ncbi:cold-shock protein [Paenibacillus glucanolyticus]|uniref:cold-shock protein n=1 Tax=Paenibacillus glucanolyticus TaxID=59843 RepID=UPI0034CF20A2